jgi:hypothetical protein
MADDDAQPDAQTVTQSAAPMPGPTDFTADQEQAMRRSQAIANMNAAKRRTGAAWTAQRNLAATQGADRLAAQSLAKRVRSQPWQDAPDPGDAP